MRDHEQIKINRTTEEKLNQFEKKVKEANNPSLVDSLIQHVEEKTNTRYYEAVKIIRKEILNRMK